MEELLAQQQPTIDDSAQQNAPKLLERVVNLPKFPRRLFLAAGIIFLVISFILLARFNDHFLVEVPEHGGMFSEGIIGRPRFINPVIAKSDADRDMTELIYSGLLRATPEGGFVPDLAKHYEVSSDGLTYTFTLRSGALWHDGAPVTSADVAYTIEKVRDQGLAIKSPKRASWEGVTVETPNQETIVFRLKQPYALFLENTTMGIIPKHIWQNVPDDEFDVTYYNIKPIGSGPYRVSAVSTDKDNGLPNYYDLVSFAKYTRGEPYITHVRMMFFGNNTELATAYADHRIDQMHTIEPAHANEVKKSGAQIEQAPLPRIFAAYFNQNQQPLFADHALREALDRSVDKTKIVSEVLLGYGRTIDGPLPSLSTTNTYAGLSHEENLAAAKKLLDQGGWTRNTLGKYEKVDKKKKIVTPLQFTIAIPDVPELKQAAELIRENWEELGASVTLRTFESSTFTSEVLAPRKYDVLFFGQVTGRTPDPYPYWHSSQRNAPGLNVALYTNKKVDKILEDARKENDPVKRNELLTQFTNAIQSDIPAIFVYSPDFIYVTSPLVQGMHTGLITTESERFLDISHWYINHERVWKWFADRMERPE